MAQTSKYALKTHESLVHFMRMDDHQQFEQLEIKHSSASPMKLELMDACRSRARSEAFCHGFSRTYNHQVLVYRNIVKHFVMVVLSAIIAIS